MSQSGLPPAAEINVSSPSDDQQQDVERAPLRADPEAGVLQPQPQQPVGKSAFAFGDDSFDSPYGVPYSRHVMLSCFVFWCCGPGCFCGLAAFFLAIQAQSADSSRAARLRGIASIAFSILGVVTGIGLTVMYLTYWQTGFHLHIKSLCPIYSWGRCYTSREKTSSWFTCIGGDYHFTDGYCYYPAAADDY